MSKTSKQEVPAKETTKSNRVRFENDCKVILNAYKIEIIMINVNMNTIENYLVRKQQDLVARTKRTKILLKSRKEDIKELEEKMFSFMKYRNERLDDGLYPSDSDVIFEHFKKINIKNYVE